MEDAVPSRTALRVALRRAAHQIYDSPLVFVDPIAVPILGERYAEELQRTPVRDDRPFSIALRAFMVGRSRYAEDHLRRAVAAGDLSDGDQAEPKGDNIFRSEVTLGLC